MFSLHYLKPSSQTAGKWLIIALVAMPIFGYGIYEVWSAVTAQKTLSSANSISGLVAHYTLDGKNTSSTNVRNGLAGYWKLDEGTGISAADSSGNGNTGTLTNSPTWATGQISNAVSFDGGNDYINIPDNTNLDGFAQASFTAWVKLNALADGTPYAILDKRTSSGTDDAYSMGLNYGAPAPCTNELEFEVGSAGGSSYVCVDKDVVTWVGQWHHVAFVYDSAATPNYRISIDGVQRTLLRSDDRNATLNNSIRDVTIGIANNAGAGPFNGLIDDVRVYNRALSTAEISAIYNYASSTVSDISGNNYNATSTDDNVIVGKIGQALSFNGANDFVSASNIGNVNSASFWINTSSTTQKMINLNATTYVELSNGTITATGFTSPTIYIDGAVSSTLTSGWHHVTITTGTTISASAVLLGKVGTNYMSGSLDDVRFYSRAITADEVSRLYKLGGTTKINKTLARPGETISSGLMAHYTLDGKDITTSTSMSATGGTITTDGDYTIHTFTSSGTFTVTSGSGDVEYLVVAGGGGGGGKIAGGGGAGGFRTATGFAVTAQAYPITVGSGGTAVAYGDNQGNNGADSTFSSITATGGGGGGRYVEPTGSDGSAGGSGGGGGSADGQTRAGGAGTAGQGSDGGSGRSGTSPWLGGGGGGASAVGANTTGTNAGNGGAGTASSISGSSVTYAGGGGGGAHSTNGVAGNGGSGGGGAGGITGGAPGESGSSTAGSGTANTGGGGGGTPYTGGTPGAGGSGIVIVRYLSPNSIANDTSGNGKNGTLTNGPAKVIGKIGQAISFDGTDDYISVGNVGSGLQSVSFWIKADNTTKKILDLNGSAYVEVSSGTITATGWTSPTIYVDGVVSSTIDTNWHHVVITTGTGINASAVDIGRVSTGYFPGTLDDVRFYSRAISASEASRLYLMGATTKINKTIERPGDPLESGLVGHWTMDGKYMTPNVRDRSTSANHGNWNFGAGTAATTTVIGKIGQALRFDGVDDYVSAGINLSGASVVTVSFWAKWTTNANDDKLVLEYTNNFNGKNGFIADWNTSTGDFSFGTSKSDSTYWADRFTRPSAGEWHHVVLVMDRATPVNTAYVDGVSQSFTTSLHNSASMGNFDNSTLYFMSRGGASLFGDGVLDDVRIYNRALSASEVKRLYDLGR